MLCPAGSAAPRCRCLALCWSGLLCSLPAQIQVAFRTFVLAFPQVTYIFDFILFPRLCEFECAFFFSGLQDRCEGARATCAQVPPVYSTAIATSLSYIVSGSRLQRPGLRLLAKVRYGGCGREPEAGRVRAPAQARRAAPEPTVRCLNIPSAMSYIL